ncbi:MAG TPA: hypothetical protein VIK80_14475 [Flavihumibacter sp.]
MKTSNKILAGMVIALLLIPTCIMIALAIKIKNDDFEIRITEWERSARANKKINNTEVMKLTAPVGSALVCTIHYSDSVYYRKYSRGDSLSVETQGDTLSFTVIKRGGKENEGANEHDDNPLHVDVFMPFRGLLMLDGAEVKIDSLAPDTELQVEMVNNSRFITAEKRPTRFSSLFVNALDSRIHVAGNTSIDNLKLNLRGKSVAELQIGAEIGSVSGSLEQTAHVSGPAKWLYQLKPVGD